MIQTTTAGHIGFVAVHVTGDDRMYCPSAIRDTKAEAAADPATWTPASNSAAVTVVAELISTPGEGDEIMGYAALSFARVTYEEDAHWLVSSIHQDRSTALADAQRRMAEYGVAVQVATVCAVEEL